MAKMCHRLIPDEMNLRSVVKMHSLLDDEVSVPFQTNERIKQGTYRSNCRGPFNKMFHLFIANECYQGMNSPKNGLAKSLNQQILLSGVDSKKLNYIHADKITRIYHVPEARFKNDEQVIQYYGYKLGEKFAEGGFAVISYATHIKTNIKVACKKVDLKKTKSSQTPDSSKMEDLKNELYILKKIDNPYIVKLYTHFVVNTNLYIFLKLANFGTLAKYMRKQGALRERQSQIFFAQMLVAIEYLHSLKIAHRDIKLENTLLLKHPNEKLTVLITDFGLSRVIAVEKNIVALSKTFCGTLDYMAPEILLEKAYNAFMVDIWALGVTLFAMLNNQFPFVSNQTSVLTKLQTEKNWKFTDNVIENPSDSLIHILTVMLEPNPKLRIKMSQLITHPWIAAEFLFAKTYFQNYNRKP